MRRVDVARSRDVLPTRRSEALAVATAAGVGLAGGLGFLAYLQARLVAGRPEEGIVGYHVDGHAGPEVGERQRIVWLGDSIAAGLGAISREVSLPHLVASHFDRPSRLHVFAVPGATAAHVALHQLPALEQLLHGLAQVGEKIDAIGVSVGANDIAAFTSRRRLRNELEAIIDATEGIPTVLLSIPQIGDAIRLPHPLRGLARLRGWWLNRVIEKVSERHRGVEYVSVRERPDWIRRKHRPHFLSSDRFHPSGAGYAVWADGIAQAFDRALATAPR